MSRRCKVFCCRVRDEARRTAQLISRSLTANGYSINQALARATGEPDLSAALPARLQPDRDRLRQAQGVAAQSPERTVDGLWRHRTFRGRLQTRQVPKLLAAARYDATGSAIALAGTCEAGAVGIRSYSDACWFVSTRGEFRASWPGLTRPSRRTRIGQCKALIINTNLCRWPMAEPGWRGGSAQGSTRPAMAAEAGQPTGIAIRAPGFNSERA